MQTSSRSFDNWTMLEYAGGGRRVYEGLPWVFSALFLLIILTSLLHSMYISGLGRSTAYTASWPDRTAFTSLLGGVPSTPESTTPQPTSSWTDELRWTSLQPSMSRMGSLILPLSVISFPHPCPHHPEPGFEGCRRRLPPTMPLPGCKLLYILRTCQCQRIL